MGAEIKVIYQYIPTVCDTVLCQLQHIYYVTRKLKFTTKVYTQTTLHIVKNIHASHHLTASYLRPCNKLTRKTGAKNSLNVSHKTR